MGLLPRARVCVGGVSMALIDAKKTNSVIIARTREPVTAGL